MRIRRPSPLILPLAFLALFFLYPLATTLVAAVNPDAWAWAIRPYAVNRMAGAVAQATASTALTLAIALPLAWHHHRVALPWSRTQLAIHAAPFVLPVFVVVGGMRELFGTEGWLSRMVGTDILTTMGPFAVIVVAHAFYNYGFAARILHATLDRRPQQLEDAAAVLGATSWGTRVRVLLPLLSPGLVSVALLVWLFSFTSFGVVLLLGNGAWSTPETLIYQNLSGAFPQQSRAAVLGLVQLAVNALLLLGYFRLHRRMDALPVGSAPHRRAAGRVDRALAGGALAIGLTPVLAVLAGGFRVRGAWTLEPWRALLNPAHADHVTGFALLPVLGRTLAYAAVSATVALALTLLLGYGLRRMGRLRGVAEGLAALPLGMSSILLGLGYMLAFGAGAWLDLRGQWLAIVVVHALIGFPFVARTVLPVMQQHDSRMDYSAQLLGAPPSHVRLRVHWPLWRAPLLAALGFAVAISIGDFGASLLLMQRDTMGLAVWIGEHDRAFDSMLQAQSVALTGLLGALAAGAYLVVERFRPKEAP